MGEGILVLVSGESGDHRYLRTRYIALVRVLTTDETQARWDAYCYVWGDESPQQSTVDDFTKIAKVIELDNSKLIGRDPN